MIKVHVTSKTFGRELKQLGDRLGATVLQGLRETAKFGRTAVVQTSAQTSPRPVASRAYEGGWVTKDTKSGAVLGNATPQAIFVEVGRKPNRKPPPSRVIEAWLIAKGVPRAQARARAFVVARAIGRKGFAGRHVLRRTMPKLRNFFKDWIRRRLKHDIIAGPRSPKLAGLRVKAPKKKS